ncbi:MAG: hypothetical protein K8E66_07135, partial [Phycisphaerales bacterium]|nr:hypothetical protein [Phycisphaerales bacterium]
AAAAVVTGGALEAGRRASRRVGDALRGLASLRWASLGVMRAMGVVDAGGRVFPAACAAPVRSARGPPSRAF